ncbi:MAG: hypothetical protein LAT61_12720 [Alcanivorax sp.]|nr:hypothetical protein [Alcanivorax sp.]
MNKLSITGPYSVIGSSPVIDDIPPGINGIYIWCVKDSKGIYRVHYVGEAQDVLVRQRNHRKGHLAGSYAGYCPEALKKNIKILMYRARQGMIAKYAHLDADEFNRTMLECMSVFYADLGPQADKAMRCRYEAALYTAVEDHGQNILQVGSLRDTTADRFEVAVDCGANNIEALSNGLLRV